MSSFFPESDPRCAGRKGKPPAPGRPWIHFPCAILPRALPPGKRPCLHHCLRPCARGSRRDRVLHALLHIHGRSITCWHDGGWLRAEKQMGAPCAPLQQPVPSSLPTGLTHSAAALPRGRAPHPVVSIPSNRSRSFSLSSRSTATSRWGGESQSLPTGLAHSARCLRRDAKRPPSRVSIPSNRSRSFSLWPRNPLGRKISSEAFTRNPCARPAIAALGVKPRKKCLRPIFSAPESSISTVTDRCIFLSSNMFLASLRPSVRLQAGAAVRIDLHGVLRILCSQIFSRYLPVDGTIQM